MNGGELMQTSHLPEPEHRTLTSSQWQVAVLGPVVDPAARGLVAVGVDTQFAQRRAIGLQLVGDDGRGLAMAVEQFSQQFRYADLRFSAALRSRVVVTTASSTSPS
ncbi:MAG: hypothetical protein RLO02_00005, partial [Roseitalea porphyridii]